MHKVALKRSYILLMYKLCVKTRRAGVAESRDARNRRVQDAASTYVLRPHMGTGVSWDLEVRSGVEIT